MEPGQAIVALGGMLTGLLVVDDLLAGVVNLDALNAAAHTLLTSETASR